MVRWVETVWETPEENLAWDDVLLGEEQEVLRVWESSVPCVVLGKSGKAEQEIDVEACRADGIPVRRRSSGGGTVLLGPGSLNFALVVSVEKRPELASVAASYRILLGLLAQAVGVSALSVCGSDLLLDGKKVSGNAQRRVRGWVLHHGTLLCEGIDFASVTRYLREPARQPLHRSGRTHGEFLGLLPLSREMLRVKLRRNLIPLLNNGLASHS